ncbi:hypothetical protein [Streptomyces sp. NPDC060031]|uniref:hypothetical protein n=1 Tax=Streptomyces sp. NPDC060031 TaxID=3347043 RepID=UPI0036A55E57
MLALLTGMRKREWSSVLGTLGHRPWFEDFSHASTPAEAAARLLDFILAEPVDRATYGELVRDGKVLPRHGRGMAAPRAS